MPDFAALANMMRERNQETEPDYEHDVWQCTIGETPRHLLPNGSDGPMRNAVSERFHDLTGKYPDFIFSGWGRRLTESQRAVVEIREPEYDKTDFGKNKIVADALDAAADMVRELQAWVEVNSKRIYRASSADDIRAILDRAAKPHIGKGEK